MGTVYLLLIQIYRFYFALRHYFCIEGDDHRFKFSSYKSVDILYNGEIMSRQRIIVSPKGEKNRFNLESLEKVSHVRFEDGISLESSLSVRKY